MRYFCGGTEWNSHFPGPVSPFYINDIDPRLMSVTLKWANIIFINALQINKTWMWKPIWKQHSFSGNFNAPGGVVKTYLPVCKAFGRHPSTFFTADVLLGLQRRWSTSKTSGWRSGKDRCSKLTSAPVTSEVVGLIPGQTHSEVVSLIPGQTHSSCDRGRLWQCRFPPTHITNCPILSIELIMSLLTLSSIQYLKKTKNI
jgi:hypothetical protein